MGLLGVCWGFGGLLGVGVGFWGFGGLLGVGVGCWGFDGSLEGFGRGLLKVCIVLYC